ncbi:MAG: alpha-2-macroglobulin family protein, partial [Planctomycetota bacterium]
MMKFLRHLSAGAFLVAMAGCGDDSEMPERGTEAPFEATERSGGTIRAEARRDIPFAFQRTETGDNADRPTLCLVFTEALDPEFDYEPFVAIEGDVALAASGQSLCVEGLSFGEEAKLTLREGLPSADGDLLASDETVTLTFADRPPVVRFSGNGVILPRRDAEGLAITTVNVPAVDVTISRVNDRALVFRRITEGYAISEGRYEYVPYDEQPGELGAPTYEG